jgi:hypothetical protein
MWGLKWGQLLWGTAQQAPAMGFWSALILGAVVGLLGIRVLRGARPPVVAALAVVITLGLPLVARALPSINTFTNGTVADATQVNANFSAVRVLTANGVSFSVGATKYCGSTSSVNGAAGGYANIKAMCQAVSGCGPSASAHMCSGEEVARSLQLGVIPNSSVGQGWYSSGVSAPTGVSGDVMNDCFGFTSNNGVWWGQVLGSGSAQAPVQEPCSNPFPVLCCD